MMLRFCCLCKSFYPPFQTISFVLHFEVGHELPVGLGQNFAARDGVSACNGEGDLALVQLHLHSKLCPSLKPSICGWLMKIPHVADGHGTTTMVAHCIGWVPGTLCLFFSSSVEHSDYYLPIFSVGDVGMKDKGPCPFQHRPQKHLIGQEETTLLLEGDVVGLDEEVSSIRSFHPSKLLQVSFLSHFLDLQLLFHIVLMLRQLL